MKKFHQFLQIALLVYFGAFLIFFIAFDTLGELFGIVEITSDFTATILLIGLILFLMDWAVGYSVESTMNSSLKKAEQDVNALKAKIYDFEHPAADPQVIDAPKKGPDSDPSTLPPRQNIT